MIYEILSISGEVINRIVADQEFVEKYYPGCHRLEEAPDLEVEGEADREPEVTDHE